MMNAEPPDRVPYSASIIPRSSFPLSYGLV